METAPTDGISPVNSEPSSADDQTSARAVTSAECSRSSSVLSKVSALTSNEVDSGECSSDS